MNRGSCVDCEEQDAVWIDNYKDELCSTCYSKRLKHKQKQTEKEKKDASKKGKVLFSK